MIGTCNTFFRPGKHYIDSETWNTGTHILYKKLKSFWSTKTNLPLLKHMSSVSLSSAKPVKSGWGSRLKHYWDLICNHLSRKTKLWELGGCDQEFWSERILFKTKSHPLCFVVWRYRSIFLSETLHYRFISIGFFGALTWNLYCNSEVDKC